MSENPQKHPHDTLIREWLDNYGAYVIIHKCAFTGKWSIITAPTFHIKYEYKLIPNQHLDVALAFYNDGAEVEFLNLDIGEWLLTKRPSWGCARQYRIKPKTKTVWVGSRDGEVWTSSTYIEGFKEVEIEV